MANLLTSRLNVSPAGERDWAKKTPADLKDQDGWPIRVTARVTRRAGNRRITGTVLATYLDWKGRPVVEVSVNGARHVFRPNDCRVQRGKAGS